MGYSNSWSRFVSCSFLADLIQLYGMDMGKLLCIDKGKEAGKPWICNRSGVYDLWSGSHERLFGSEAIAGSWFMAVSWRHRSGNHPGVCYFVGNGKALPHKLVGLQRTAVQPAWQDLSGMLDRMGIFHTADV